MSLITLSCLGVEKTLADWGLAAGPSSRPVRTVNNQAADYFAFDLAASCDAAPDPFPFGSSIILRIGRLPAAVQPNGLPASGQRSFTGGKVFFVGWRVDCLRTAGPETESLRYKFAGPWEFFLERLVFQKLFLTWNGSQQVADYRSQVVLGQSLTALTGPSDTVPGTIATDLMSISQQIREIVSYCLAQTAAQYGSPQFQFDDLTQDGSGHWTLTPTPGPNCQIPDYVPGTGTGSGGNGLAPGQTTVPLRAPLEAVQDITCAEAIRRQLRWIGGVGSPVVWFDYTTLDLSGNPLPTLKIATRDQLPSIALPAFSAPPAAPSGLAGTKALSITRRDDLIPTAVDLIYRVLTSAGGGTFTQVFHDIACAAGATNASTGVTDSSLLAQARGFGAQVVTLDFEGGSVTEHSASITTIPLQLSGSADSYACYKAIWPELLHYSNLSGGYTAITDPETGATVDPSPYDYILRDGGIASWMAAGSVSGAAKRVLVEAQFSGLHDDGGAIAGAIKVNAHLTLCNLPTGTYAAGSVTVSEQIPWGLASYIYNVEKTPQYQGTYTLQELEVADACPMGNNLNLTGSLPEWQTMNACVQQITYDLDAGATTLTFGPAAHLGAQDLVERLRVNRFPRFYYLIGGDLLNS